MEIIHQEFYGNSILNWAIAVGILILSFVVVKMLYWIFSNVIRRLTSKTNTKLDDVLIDKLEKPLTYLVLILGYWISIHYLVFKEEVENKKRKENNVKFKQNNLFINSIKFPKTVKLY